MTINDPALIAELDSRAPRNAYADEGARVDVDRGNYLTRAELDRIRSELTMGDTWRARKVEPDDRRRIGMIGLWIVAKRLGLADPAPDNNEAALLAFLDRMRVDDVNESYAPDAEAARLGKAEADTAP